MPFGDRTGPQGMGPMTGRSLGYCAGYSPPGFTRPGFGRGYGRGRRGGYRNWYRAAGLPGWYRANIGMLPWGRYEYSPTPEQEKQVLTQEKEAISQEMEFLKEQMKEIKKRIKDLEGTKKK